MVLAGGSCLVIAAHQGTRDLTRPQAQGLCCVITHLTFGTPLISPSNLQKEMRNPVSGQMELLQLGGGQCIGQECRSSAGVAVNAGVQQGNAPIGHVVSFQPRGTGKHSEKLLYIRSCVWVVVSL